MIEFYTYLVAAHVTAVIFFAGSMIACERMCAALARDGNDHEMTNLITLYDIHKKVTTPALLLTWLFGLGVAIWAEWLPSLWLIIKLVFVVALSALHGIQSGRLRRALRDGTRLSVIPGAGYGMAAMTALIVFLAVVKPLV